MSKLNYSYEKNKDKKSSYPHEFHINWEISALFMNEIRKIKGIEDTVCGRHFFKIQIGKMFKIDETLSLVEDVLQKEVQEV